jgi:AcrR family transcriptional regulator
MTTESQPVNRFERRRAKTREALIGAARQILAESGDTSVSIQTIAERADVGFGTFYNHFPTKTDLFDAAVAEVLDEYGQAIDAYLTGVEDPAERVAAGVRLSVRMVESHPEVMKILHRRGFGHIHSDRGLSPRALEDIKRGIASGRFAATDPLVALTAMGGSLLALVETRFAHPEIEGDEAAASMAELMLRMLGLDGEQARQLARAPLPAADRPS